MRGGLRLRAGLTSYDRRERLAIGVLVVQVIEGEAGSGERPGNPQDDTRDIVGDDFSNRITIRITVTISRFSLDHICQGSPIGIDIVRN